ncbi:MAG: MFS transporter [Deltaproteobacteria bacterium]|nr:MFS transporter [Deltaproteobacteria bacterium]
MRSADGDAVPDPRPLLNRDFLLLWQGQLVSLVGSQAFSLALLYWAMEATGSASVLGVVSAAAVLPGLLLTPLGGAVADRCSRRRILVSCDAASGLSSLALAGSFLLLAPGSPVLTAAVVGAALLDRALLAFFIPALGAALPELVPPRRLAAANSLTQLSHQAASVAGRAVAGALYAWVGAPALFLLDGLTFLYAAGSEALVRFPSGAPAPSAAPLGSSRSVASDLSAAAAFLRSRPALFDLLLVVALTGALAQPVFVLLPFYVTQCLGQGPRWYGFLLAAHAAGAVAGLSAAALPGAAVRGGRSATVALALGSGCVGALALVRHPWSALVLVAGVGGTSAAFNVALQSLFQLETPSELRGRVMALLQTAAMGAAAVGAVLGGIGGDLTGKNVPLVYAVCGGLSTLAAVWLWGRPAGRQVPGFRREAVTDPGGAAPEGPDGERLSGR